MPNPWVEHIKEFAKKTGKTYGCALSDPECKSSYKSKKETPIKVKDTKNNKPFNKTEYLNVIKTNPFAEEQYLNSLGNTTTTVSTGKTLAQIQKDRLETSKFAKQISNTRKKGVKALLNSQTIIEPKKEIPIVSSNSNDNDYNFNMVIRKKKKGAIL
jgi:hypothetical protein